jgi:hypothetical protein
MTTYDIIWTKFFTICKIDNFNLPQTNEGIYNMIQNGVALYNNRLRDSLECTNETETVNRELNNDELLLVANFIKLSYLENEKNYFIDVWQPFAKDIQIHNYQATLKGKQEAVYTQEAEIDKLILNMQEDYM